MSKKCEIIVRLIRAFADGYSRVEGDLKLPNALHALADEFEKIDNEGKFKDA